MNEKKNIVVFLLLDETSDIFIIYINMSEIEKVTNHDSPPTTSHFSQILTK